MDMPQNGAASVATPAGSEIHEKQLGSSPDNPLSGTCQLPTKDSFSLWIKANADALLPPSSQVFGFMPERKRPWEWSDYSQIELAHVAKHGAMYITSVGYYEKPMPTGDEQQDLFNNATLRWGHLHFDLDGSAEKADSVYADLRELVFGRLASYGVSPGEVAIYCSGGKGYHVSVFSSSIGSVLGDRLLPSIYKIMANKIAGGLKSFDARIYNMGEGRLFRLPNVQRQNGRYKVPLLPEEIQEGGLKQKQIERLSQQPRFEFSLPNPERPVAEKLAKLYREAREESREKLLRRKTTTVVLSEEKKAELRAIRRPCLRYVLSMRDYGDNPELNFHDLLAYVVIPALKEEGYSLDEAEADEEVSNFLEEFHGSPTFSTSQQRWDEFRRLYGGKVLPFQCRVAESMLPGLDCGRCPHPGRTLDATESFAPFMPEGGKTLGRGFTAGELLDAEFEPVKWAVDGLLPAGLSILAGAPKLGKSWLVLSIAIAVATGGKALGYAESEPGKVLYLALEDGPRRLQDRLMKLLSGEEMDAASRDRLRLETTWDAMDKGGLEKLAQYCKDNPDLRLIIIDTWARFKPTKRQRGANSYEVDAEHAAPLQKFAENLPVLIITHDTKMKTEDIYEGGITGSKGLPGVADTLMVFKRKRGSQDAELYIDGRDIEPKQLAFHWGESPFAWNYSGRVEEVRRSKERQEVIDLLSKASDPMTPTDIARALDKKLGNIKVLLGKMATAGEVARESGRYSILQAW